MFLDASSLSSSKKSLNSDDIGKDLKLPQKIIIARKCPITCNLLGFPNNMKFTPLFANCTNSINKSFLLIFVIKSAKIVLAISKKAQ